MKLNRIQALGYRLRASAVRLWRGHTNDPDSNTSDTDPPTPDIIDRICDFLSFRLDQHLDRWQVMAALVLAAIIILFSLVGFVRARVASSVSVQASASAKDGSAAGGKGSGADKTRGKPGYAYVYVCGAVRQPGVYRTPASSRVNTAIALAGGLASNADATRINLARRVIDGERIYVPRAGETVTPDLLDNGLGSGATADGSGDAADNANGSGDSADSGDGPGSGASGPGSSGSDDSASGRGPAWRSDGRLNLNLATAADLDSLPGIGPAYAARILDYRQKHNGFTDIEQLGNIRGIGPKTLAKLKPLVYVE